MQTAGLPHTTEEALIRVKQSTSTTDGFAFLGLIMCFLFSIISLLNTKGEATAVKYAALTDPCNFAEVGEEFSRKPYALAVQKGSYLKDQLSERYHNKVIKSFIDNSNLDNIPAF